MLPECVQLLIEAGQVAPSADNMQPWRFSWDGECLSLWYGAARDGGQIFTELDSASLLAMGAAAENVLQVAALMGLPNDAVDVEGGPSPAPYLRLRLYVKPTTRPEMLGNPVFLRHTNRMPYGRTPVPDDLRHTLQRLKERSAAVRVITDVGQRREVDALVRTASQARFQIRQVHEWFMATLRYSAAEVDRGDGLDVRTLDLPPGGAPLLRTLRSWRAMSLANKLGAYRIFAGIESRPIVRGPAIFAIYGENSLRGAFSAGRLMERVWLSLNSRGIAVQPYYVVTDVIERLGDGKSQPSPVRQTFEGFAEKVRLTFDLPIDAKLYIFLRAGLPQKPPVRARRLPIERICV